MDDRELIAQAIVAEDPAYRIPFDYLSPRDKARAYRQADAVLAALDGRVLPELPEGWELWTLHWMNTTTYRAELIARNDQGLIYRKAVGEAPDPFTAYAAALAEAGKEQTDG